MITENKKNSQTNPRHFIPMPGTLQDMIRSPMTNFQTLRIVKTTQVELSLCQDDRILF